MNKYYLLQGKVKWFRPDKANQWNKYEHVLYPDQKSLDIIKELQSSTQELEGIKNQLKKDDDGYFIRIGRPSSKTIKGRVVGFTPPMVFEKDGKTPIKNIYIGNGSDITTKVEVYTHGTPRQGVRAKAMRWESTRIDNLIPYEGNRDTIGFEKKALGLDEAPLQNPAYF